MTSESGLVPTINIGVHDTKSSVPVSTSDETAKVKFGVIEPESTSCVHVTLNDESSVVKLGLHDVKSGINLRYADFGGVANGGSGGGGGSTNILRGSTLYWDSQRSLIAENGTVYIYTDHSIINNGNGTYTIYPAIKIGDGTSYLIDMPFVDGDVPIKLQNHINNAIVHVTAEEKDFWNNKWRGYMNLSNPENLVFTIH